MKRASRENSIEDLLAQEQWTAARRLLQRDLLDDPDNHWLLTQIGSTLYEQRKYRDALKWLHRSSQIVPDCPLTLWHLAGTLDALGRSSDAVAIYLWLLTSKTSADQDPCWESVKWSDSLKTDCLFWLGISFEHMNRSDTAELCFRQYINLLLIGMTGSYPLEEAAKKVRRLHGSDSPRQSQEGLQDTIDSMLRDSGVRSLKSRGRKLPTWSLDELLAS